MHLIGLTGGTGSGKSEAGRRFESHGIPVLDADAVGHMLIAPGGALETAVVEAFGRDILTENRIDRKKLGALVFADAQKRAQLNALLHPAIREEVGQRCADLAGKGYRVAILDAALLAERGTLDPYLRGLILVLAPRETRAARLVASRGMDAAAAELQIDAQTPPEKKRAVADWIIHNDGTIQDLHLQVDTIAEELRRRYA